MKLPSRVSLLVDFLLGGLSRSLFSADDLSLNGNFEEEKNERAPNGWSNSIDGVRDFGEMYVGKGREGVDTHMGIHAIKLKVSTRGGFAEPGPSLAVYEEN